MYFRWKIQSTSKCVSLFILALTPNSYHYFLSFMSSYWNLTRVKAVSCSLDPKLLTTHLPFKAAMWANIANVSIHLSFKYVVIIQLQKSIQSPQPCNMQVLSWATGSWACCFPNLWSSCSESFWSGFLSCCNTGKAVIKVTNDEYLTRN